MSDCLVQSRLQLHFFFLWIHGMCTLLGDTPYSAAQCKTDHTPRNTTATVCAPSRNEITITIGTRLQLHSVATLFYRYICVGSPNKSIIHERSPPIIQHRSIAHRLPLIWASGIHTTALRRETIRRPWNFVKQPIPPATKLCNRLVLAIGVIVALMANIVNT